MEVRQQLISLINGIDNIELLEFVLRFVQRLQQNWSK